MDVEQRLLLLNIPVDDPFFPVECRNIHIKIQI